MIFINDSRFANPQVGASEKPRLKAKIAKSLRQIRSPEGDPLIKRVVDGGATTTAALMAS